MAIYNSSDYLNYSDGSITLGDSAIGGDALFIQGLGAQAVSDPGMMDGSNDALGIWGDSNVIPATIGVGKNATPQIIVPTDTQGIGIFSGIANTFTKAVNIANGVTGFLGKISGTQPKTTAQIVAPGPASFMSSGSNNVVQQNQLQNPGQNSSQGTNPLVSILGAFILGKVFKVF